VDREGILNAAASADRRRKRKKRAPGLDIIERDGNWHIHGTIHVRGRAKRIRRSTELPARSDTKEAALEIKRQIETQFVNEVVYGIKPSVALAVAARRYLGLNEEGEKLPGQGKDLGPTDLKILQTAVHEFGLRHLNLIAAEEWSGWAHRQNLGNTPRTLVRFMTPVLSFLRWCAGGDRQWLKVPYIELPKLPYTRHWQRRRVAELSPELLAFLFDHAPLHLKAQLYTEWSTGARVSSILFGCRLCDLTLAPQRSQITFHDTKNGDRVTAHLHPAAAEVLAEYLDHRGHLERREGPLFLTHMHRPYSRRGRERGWSGFNKTAFVRTRQRAVKVKWRAAAVARVTGDRTTAASLWAEAALLAQVTQHWMRHWFATHALAMGMDLRSIGEQGGWRDYRSIQGYQHDVPEVRRRHVENLPIGKHAIDTSFTREPGDHAKKG
jgi:site-specific recombinase XerD